MSDTQTYLLDDNGKLFRQGKHLATVNATSNELEFVDPADRSKYGAPVAKWLKEEAKRRDEKAKAAEEGTGVTTPAPIEPGSAEHASLAASNPAVLPFKPLTEADKVKAEANSLAAEGARETEKYLADLNDDRVFANRMGCPPPPNKNPQFGDKTPAYVEWLKEYRPDKWREKFGVKGKGQVPVLQTIEGRQEVVGYREADMATRKTHMTEKIEGSAGLADGLSWDA